MRDTAAAIRLSESVAKGLSEGVEVLGLVRARQAFQALEEWLLSQAARQLALHEVEQEQERRGREVQRLLLEAHVASRGYGDVGPAIQVQAVASEGEPVGVQRTDRPVVHTEKRMDPRHLSATGRSADDLWTDQDRSSGLLL